MRRVILGVIVMGCLGCGVPKSMLISNRTDLGPMDNVVTVKDLTPEQFLEQHASEGRIGLVGGIGAISKGIREAEGLITPDRKASLWSHIWLFEGRRADENEWILESSLEWKWWPPQILNGIQENRLSKYYKNPKKGCYFAVIDWELSDGQKKAVIAEGLKLLSERKPYPVGNLFKTLWLYWYKPEIFRSRQLRGGGESYYCSAYVQKDYEVGAHIDFNDKVPTAYTSPEHIWLGSLHAKGKCKIWLLDNDEIPTFGQKILRVFKSSK